MLHVVLLAHYTFHCFLVGIERAVQFSVMFQGIGGILYLGLQLINAPFLFNSSEEGVFIEKQHSCPHHYCGEESQRQIPFAPCIEVVHYVIGIREFGLKPLRGCDETSPRKFYAK